VTAPPPGPHLDLDVLADIEEGLVPGVRAGDAERHLEHCAECQRRLARLRTTRALLTTLPAEPMPPAVVARVNDAVAAAAHTSPTIVPMTRRSTSWNTPAIAGVAAAVAVLVLVGAVVIGNVAGHHRSSPSAGSAGGTSPRRPAAPAADVKEWATGTNYTPANLAAKVPALVTGTPPSTLSKSFAAGATAASPSAASSAGTPTTSAEAYTLEQLRASRDAIIGCGRILGGGVPTVPIAVDFARFNGRQAVVFVLPAVDHAATQLDVWVLPGTCSTSTIPLFIRRVPRP
jgi:hypothetical protein